MRDLFGDGIARGDLHFARIAQHFQRELLQRVLERGREQQGLALARQLAEDALDRGQEAHVEHAVGFVEHEHLDAGQIDIALVEVVDQAAGAGDEHVDAATQGVDLRVHADAAVDGGDLQALVLAVGADAVVHLHGQLARGDEDQGARPAIGALSHAVQALQHRQHEGRGLAGTGLGAAQQVVAGENQRDGFGLDGRGRGVVAFGKRANERGREPERFKGHVLLRFYPERSLEPRCESIALIVASASLLRRGGLRCETCGRRPGGFDGTGRRPPRGKRTRSSKRYALYANLLRRANPG